VAGVFLSPATDLNSIAMVCNKSLQSLLKDYQLRCNKTKLMSICMLPGVYKNLLLPGGSESVVIFD
jgi:hypothetical protein